MGRILLFTLFACICHLSVNAQFDDGIFDYSERIEYEIGGISVTGAETFDAQAIRSLSGLRVGDMIEVPSEATAEVIKRLWDRNLFANVELLGNVVNDQIFFEIKVMEMPRLSRYSLTGIKNSEINDLKDKLKLRSGIIVNDNLKLNITNNIRAFYTEKGFPSSTVQLNIQDDSILPNTVLMTIEIEKGPKVKVNSITFIGNQNVPDGKLKKAMKETNEKVKFDVGKIFKKNQDVPDTIPMSNTMYALNNMSPTKLWERVSDNINLNFFKSSKFLEDNYERDKQAVIAKYNTLGYRDATIAFDTVFFADEKSLDIVMHIDEGNRYYFRNITFSGNTMYSDSVLLKVLDIHPGDVYNPELLDTRLYMNPSGLDVSSIYMDRGHLFFNITPVESLAANDSIDIELNIYEGPEARINQVFIEGNTKTNEHVIRRELRVLPGDVFSREAIIRSQREIINLGYFDPELMDVQPIPNPEDGTVDVKFGVVEKPSDQLELSAGWAGRGRGIVGTLGVSFTNFSLRNIFDGKAWSPLPSGDGQRLSLRIQSNGKVYQSYNLSFTEPWLGGRKPNAFTFSFFRSRFNDLDSDRAVTGHLITTGVSVGLGTRLKWPDDFFTFLPSVNFERYDLDNWVSTSFANFLFTDGIANNFNIRLVLARNSLQGNPIYPTGGSHFSVGVAFTPPYSLMGKRKDLCFTCDDLPDEDRWKWIEYHKWDIRAEWFVALDKQQKLTLRAVGKMGFLGMYNRDVGLSPFERYELGGDGISNVQFFGRDIISLRGYPILTPNEGAAIYNKFTLELRYPLSLNPSATIYALGFLEAGNYWSNIKDYNPFDLRRAVGVGVRVFLPMFGLLGFDYGIGIDKIGVTGNNIFAKYGEFRIILGFEPE